MLRLPVLLVISTTGLLAACGYAPPPRTDTATPAYKTDYAACDTSVPDAVAKRNAKTGLAWMTSPITRWSQIDDGMGACMAAKGWGRVRACTADELRAGANRLVTARGVQCTDPSRTG